MSWRNRIVGYRDVPVGEILSNPRNARVHGWAQEAALTDVLERVGIVQNVILNQRTGRLVDGHLRLALALRRGEAALPATVVELDESEEALVLATFDPLGALAELDPAKLDGLLRDVQTGSAALQEMLADLRADAGLADEGDDASGGGTAAGETLHDQAIQLRPAREYVVVICDTEAEFEELKRVLALRQVRRGGYRPGSAFDAVGTERVVPAERVIRAIAAGSPRTGDPAGDEGGGAGRRRSRRGGGVARESGPPAEGLDLPEALLDDVIAEGRRC